MWFAMNSSDVADQLKDICYHFAVYGDDIRQARRDAKLSQSELARRAGVPRSQLVRLEQGENVTIDTLQRVLGALPHLKQITLVPGATALAAGIDVDEVRAAAQELHESSARLLRAIGGGRPADRSMPHPALIARLERIIDELEAGQQSHQAAVGAEDE